MGWQVHGTDLREWDGPDPQAAYAQPGDKQLPRVDGHLTPAAGSRCWCWWPTATRSRSRDGERAAMLHCGWRPLAGGIVEKAVARFDAAPAAAVGPGIGGCCYEVGPEVAERFADVPGAVDGRMLDLRRVIARGCAAAGVTRGRRTSTAAPAASRSCYFSHRRDRGSTGRQAGLCVLSG